MKRVSILIIEDDEATLELLRSAMQEDEGCFIRTAKTMEEGFKAVEAANTDLIILDRGLPDGDGIRLCLTLKKDSRFRDIPVLILTGRAEPADRVLGLRLGADDYLAKPFVMDELLARVDALIRRSQTGPGGGRGRLDCGGVVMDLRARQVAVDGEPLRLVGMEYELLRVLMERAGTALTREFLLEAVWKAVPGTVGPKTVDVAVMALRKKLGEKGDLIVAVRSCGYVMSAPGKRGR